MAYDTLFIQKNYADELASRLQLWVKKRDSPYLANFRCDICGDSATRKFIKRGYIITSDKGNLLYYCQNCHVSIPLTLYLEQHHNDLYRRYLFEAIGNRQVKKTDSAIELSVRQSYEPSYRGLTPIQDLNPKHHCIKYLQSRLLAPQMCKRLFYCEKFFTYVNSVIPGKFPAFFEKKDHDRLILPLLTKEGTLFGVIGRAFSDDVQSRYLTIKFDDNYPKIFGLDRVDFSKHIDLFEGPIDSLFWDNNLALAGTDADISQTLHNKSRFTLVLDNQPRNKEVVAKYRKYVYNDYNTCIWPQGLPGKDVNDLIKAGYSPSEVKQIIRDNTHRGPMATVAFNNWRKV